MHPYLTRPAEHLVLHGYRCVTRGLALGSREPWREADELYGDVLGARRGRVALDLLSDFIGTIGLCARCPLRMLSPGAPCLCRDEAFVLGLIAASQHGDDAPRDFCLTALSRERFAAHVGGAAASYALMLKASGQVLLPVPLDALRAIHERDLDANPATPQATIH